MFILFAQMAAAKVEFTSPTTIIKSGFIWLTACSSFKIISAICCVGLSPFACK